MNVQKNGKNNLKVENKSKAIFFENLVLTKYIYARNIFLEQLT